MAKVTNKSAKTAAKRAMSASMALVAPAAAHDGVARSELITVARKAVSPMVPPPVDGAEPTPARIAFEKRVKALRHECVIGWLSTSPLCKANSDEARIQWARDIAALTNPDSKAKAGKRRTKAQQTAYGTAAKRWNRFRVECEIDPADKRGGNNKTGKNGSAPKQTVAESDPVEKPTLEQMTKAKAKTATEVNERIFALYQTALGYLNNNAKVASVKAKGAVEEWRVALVHAGIIVEND